MKKVFLTTSYVLYLRLIKYYSGKITDLAIALDFQTETIKNMSLSSFLKIDVICGSFFIIQHFFHATICNLTRHKYCIMDIFQNLTVFPNNL